MNAKLRTQTAETHGPAVDNDGTCYILQDKLVRAWLKSIGREVKPSRCLALKRQLAALLHRMVSTLRPAPRVVANRSKG